MDGSYGVGKYSLLVLLYLVTAAGLAWAWMMGEALIGLSGWTRMSVATGAPLVCLWLMFAWTKFAESADNWHFRYMVISSLLILVVAFQPWNPRAIFVRKLFSIEPGMTKQEVEATMSGYEKIGIVEIDYGNTRGRPSEAPTHYLYYKWHVKGPHYDADVGKVYFRDGRVVSRRFSGD